MNCCHYVDYNTTLNYNIGKINFEGKARVFEEVILVRRSNINLFDVQIHSLIIISANSEILFSYNYGEIF